LEPLDTPRRYEERKTMGHRISHLPLLVALALLSLLILVPAASADFVLGGPGTGAGQYERPRGVAVDTSNGHAYLADTENNRIDVFDESGAFLFAFGWKVNATSPEEKLQVCTTATGCRAGTTGLAGAGQLNGPSQIAVDSTSHAVYVSENQNHRVQKFDSEGHFEWMVGGEVDKVTHANLCTVAADCGAGKEAEKAAGKEEGRFFFAVSALPVAVGPGGVLYVADPRRIGPGGSIEDDFNTRIQRFEADGTYLGPQLLLAGETGRVLSLAVDSVGDAYVGTNGSSSVGAGHFPVYKYDPAGNLVSGWGENGEVELGSGYLPLTLDPAGDLFAGEGYPAGAIAELDPSGAKAKVFFPALLGGRVLSGLAFYHSASGDLFATSPDANALLRISLPEPGPLLVPGSAKACPVGNVRATLCVSFNPEGKASHAHFQYIAKAAYEANLAQGKDGFGGAAETPESAPTPADFANTTVEATNACTIPTEASCLKPETTYYFRAIATNPDGEAIGEKAEFTTLPPLEINAVWSSDVGTDTARLHAEVNPLGIHAGAYFEYIAEGADYQEHGFEHAISVPDPAHPLDFGSGEAPKAGVSQIYPLEPGTTYHYRLVAEDGYFPALTSVIGTFTTLALPGAGEEGCPNQAFRAGPSAALPDCRAYEMVTPLDKNNGDVITRGNHVGYPTYLDQSSTEGAGFTYSSYRAFGEPEGAPFTNQYLAARHERGQAGEGWQTAAIDPPRGKQFRLEFESTYKAFSADLSNGWFLQESEPTLDPCAPAGFDDLYRRDGSGALQALNCTAVEHVEPLEFLPEIQGFSADGSRSVFRANAALTPEASKAKTPAGLPIYQVYESTGAGQLRLISTLPDGSPSGADSSAGTSSSRANSPAGFFNFNRFGSLTNAVSEDGTRVFWSASKGGEDGPIYLRTNADKAQSKIEAGQCTQAAARACTIAVSETVSKEPAYFQAANPQGTKALFTISAGPLQGNLYEFDSEAQPPASQLIAEGVQAHILGASADLSRIYYASTVASAQQQAEGALEGKPNVYLAKDGTSRFIATLTSGSGATDVRNPFGSPNHGTPIYRTARVSADGESLAFMSNSKQLSEQSAGYDNTDAQSGEPDAEVYLYDAGAGEGKGALRCVSCNPSGARPSGGRETPGGNADEKFSVAARVPTFENQLYQPRYLSDDGKRVFFDSYEGLVLTDTNGKQDVYEWEAGGSGSCSSERRSYVPASQGCLSLLSSGQSPADSEFLDADPSGANAFFTTAEGLVPQDYGLVDLYDARIDGGFPQPPATPPVCEGEACQSPPEAPNDPTPASAAFEGAGNVVEKPASRKHRKKHKAKGKTKSKAKHQRAKRNRRAPR
jgi:DNA-binding beta-propeller fold protein YncE